MLKKFIISIFFSILLIPSMVFALENDFSSFLDVAGVPGGEDIFTPDTMDCEKTPYTVERTLRAFTRSCSNDCDGIVQAQDIFRRDLYNVTYPLLQRRSLLDNPQYYFYACLPCWCRDKIWQPFVHLYYNEARKANLTRDRTGISSYLAFENIPNLEQFGLDIDAQRVLSLFRDLRVEQRRSGVMLGAAHRYNNWYFSFRTPVEYLIRNFFLNNQEKKAIEADPLFNDIDPTTNNEDEINHFAREHLISDRLGIGDTRLNVGYLAVNRPDQMLVVGGEMTVPTAFSVKKGLYGSHFPLRASTPTIDLCLICNLIMDGDLAQVQQLLLDFGVKALDRLSTILLETSLGNGGHFGIGPVLEHRMCVTPKLEFRTRANLEYILPSTERRFFIRKKNPTDFDRFNNPNANNSHEDLKFLEQQIVQTFFPEGFNTLVYPGFIFKLTNALSGSLAKNRVLVSLGHDLWWQQKEELGKISALPSVRETLRTDIAKRPPAFQSTLFGSVTYFRIGRKYDWCVKAYADTTLFRSGIGRAFNLGLRFELLL